jgi:hypothetical protein
LIFSSAPLSGPAQRGLINERAIQSTCNDPLRTRDVKHGLSRSFPPLLWISVSRGKNFQIFFVQPIARVVKQQADELCLHSKEFFFAAPPTPIARLHVRCRPSFSRLRTALLRAPFTREISRQKCRRARASAAGFPAKSLRQRVSTTNLHAISWGALESPPVGPVAQWLVQGTHRQTVPSR